VQPSFHFSFVGPHPKRTSAIGGNGSDSSPSATDMSANAPRIPLDCFRWSESGKKMTYHTNVPTDRSEDSLINF
jgi:hypothetical protein